MSKYEVHHEWHGTKKHTSNGRTSACTFFKVQVVEQSDLVRLLIEQTWVAMTADEARDLHDALDQAASVAKKPEATA